MTRTPDQALKYTHDHPSLPRAGLCKMMCRTAYDVPSDGSPDATAAWGRTKHRGTGPAPRGALHWWIGGRNGHGHVAIEEGGGSIRTTDLPTSARWGSVPLSTPTRVWGLRYVGWSRDIDGRQVVPDPPKPASRLATIRRRLSDIANDRRVGPVRRRKAREAAARLKDLS